jgi:hypothetical protein
MLSVFKQNVVIPSVSMLCIVRLNVVYSGFCYADCSLC